MLLSTIAFIFGAFVLSLLLLFISRYFLLQAQEVPGQLFVGEAAIEYARSWRSQLSFGIFLFVLIYQWFSQAFFPWPYVVFLSVLAVATRTDLEVMAIPSLILLPLVPLAFVVTFFEWIPVTFSESVSGALVGYCLFRFIREAHFYIRGAEGLGQADEELAALIGAFLGPLGLWVAVMVASCVGICSAVTRLIFGLISFDDRMPFGPLLAAGSVVMLVARSWIETVLQAI